MLVPEPVRRARTPMYTGQTSNISHFINSNEMQHMLDAGSLNYPILSSYMPKTRPDTRPDTKERSVYYQSNPVNYQDSIQITTTRGGDERSSSRHFQGTSRAPSRQGGYKTTKYDYGMPEMAMPYNINGFTQVSHDETTG